MRIYTLEASLLRVNIPDILSVNNNNNEQRENMYRITDTSQAIREVQRYLLTVSQLQHSLPHITVDGIFGNETRVAVKAFQELNNLETSGTVDKTTFDLLYLEHLRLLNVKSINDSNIRDKDYPLEIGDSNESVIILNALIAIISDFYDITFENQGDFYSASTQNAVKELQIVFGLDGSGIADKAFVDRLFAEIRSREKFKKRL